MIDAPINELDAAALVASHLALADKHLAAAAPVTEALDVLPPQMTAEIVRRLDDVAERVEGLRGWIETVAIAAV
jgi:hypothetical protein